MAEAGGIIGCLVLLGCCGACFACGRGCKSDSSTQVREPQQQPARIVVAPVIVQATTPTQAIASAPTGYLVVTDPVTGQQQLYAPVAPLTPTAAAAVLAASSTNTQADVTELLPPAATEATAGNIKHDDLQKPLLQANSKM